MEYFFYCRGRPGTEALLEELAEAHWSFMDGYAESMIARGPTLTSDGSALLLQVRDRAAVETMLAGAPYVQAGLYLSMEIHDWQFGGRPQG